MSSEVYKNLLEVMKKRGGGYAGMDIPEFYEMASALFTPEEAAAAVALPKGFSTAAQVAETLDRSEEEVESLLQSMASKGLCASRDAGGTEV